jgi:hypothetical protein
MSLLHDLLVRLKRLSAKILLELKRLQPPSWCRARVSHLRGPRPRLPEGSQLLPDRVGVDVLAVVASLRLWHAYQAY